MTLAAQTEPFRHLIVDDAFPADVVAEASASWPRPDAPGWVIYASALERKRTLNVWSSLALAQRLLLVELYGLKAEDLLGLEENLTPDIMLWGAGLHAMVRGDFLSTHLDSDRHPHQALMRRVNALLFVSPVWREEWGGHLELWPPALDRPAVRVLPAPGRLVLFEAGDQSFHSVAPVTCPPEVTRQSLAVYFFGASKRPRALFVGTANELPDPARDTLRAERSRF